MKRRTEWSPGIVAPLLTLIAILFFTGGCHSIVFAPWYRYQIKANLHTSARMTAAHYAVENGIPTLHVSGTPAEMGAQYGALLKRPLRAMHHYLHCIMPRSMQRRLMTTAMAQEPYLPAPIREELSALAGTSGVPYEELVAINTLARLYCSVLAVWGPVTSDGALIMGRNAEYFSLGLSDRGSLLVVFHPADGVPTAALGFLGMVGAYTGVNANGVSFGNMLVFNADKRGLDPRGMPIALAMRLAAQKAQSADEFVAIVKGAPPKIPVNVMAADRKEALVAEIGLNGSHVWRGRNGALAASNDFRDAALSDGSDGSRCERYQSLLASASAQRGKFTVQDMQAALQAAQIKDLNIQAAVFEPGAMRMHLSVNRRPASAGPYVTVDLRKLFSEAP